MAINCQRRVFKFKLLADSRIVREFNSIKFIVVAVYMNISPDIINWQLNKLCENLRTELSQYEANFFVLESWRQIFEKIQKFVDWIFLLGCKFVITNVYCNPFKVSCAWNWWIFYSRTIIAKSKLAELVAFPDDSWIKDKFSFPYAQESNLKNNLFKR